MRTTTLLSVLLFAAVCVSFLSIPNVTSQSAMVTTSTTINQPSQGQCSEVSMAFSGNKGKEIFGQFGSDASISFYVLSPSDFTAIQNPTCSLPSSSRPLYSQINVVGFGNPFRSLPFPSDGTYYFVFVLGGGGTSQLGSGYANLQLIAPASTNFVSAGVTSAVSSSSVVVATTGSPTQSITQMTAQSSAVQSVSQSVAQTASQSVQSTAVASTVVSTGPSFGTLGIVGVVVAVALIASVMVVMKRGKGLGGQKTVLKQETVQKEAAPAPKPEVKAEVKPQVSQSALTTAGESISTGYPELDQLLAGGLPIGYAILVVSPPCDERDLLFRKVIESSLSMGSQIFFLSRDLIRTQDFANRYGKDFHVFSPQADKLTSVGGKVHKIQGLQNLSDLNISFTKAVEELGKELITLRKPASGKLVIIDLLSDVLLEHKALLTRKWLDGFIGKRKAEGFTIIGVLNPLISSQQDTQTIMDLFDGIIEIYERELKERARRFLIVKKMYGRRYGDSELMLDKDKLY